MIQVLEILDGGQRAIVSTKDLFRIVSHDQDGDEIKEELFERFEADAFVQGYGGDPQAPFWAEVITYVEAFEREQSDEKLNERTGKIFARRLAAGKKKKPGKKTARRKAAK